MTDVATFVNTSSHMPLGYWQGLASGAGFAGSTLELCLATIHVDIISSWNYNDPDNVRFLFIAC